ncbi:MAG: hypothetical protein KKH98_15340 [Spirochaetes bacterium]|nr:hypothetical protein [Spirochaetota bacterium]
MKNNNKYNNMLIKRIKLKKRLYKAGIKRINAGAIIYLENTLENNINDFIDKLARILLIKGKKTLEKDDIDDLLKKLENKEKSWEI